MDTLNPAQQAAVKYLDGPLLVLAGAGSGKTRVIVQKIAHLIREAGFRPAQVAAVTFTNKAAREMRERVARLLGRGEARGLRISTFHTLGLDILFRKQFYTSLLNEYFDEQRTILITTHQVEEVEHILTDLMFIKDGRLIVNSSMDDIYEQYTEVMVHPDYLEPARAMNPIHERVLFGRHIMLFDQGDTAKLGEFGEIHKPSVADLFVALMGDQQQTVEGEA